MERSKRLASFLLLAICKECLFGLDEEADKTEDILMTYCEMFIPDWKVSQRVDQLQSTIIHREWLNELDIIHTMVEYVYYTNYIHHKEFVEDILIPIYHEIPQESKEEFYKYISLLLRYYMPTCYNLFVESF